MLTTIYRRARGLGLRAAMSLTLAAVAACGGGGSDDASFKVDRTEGTQSAVYEGEDVPSVFIHARVDNAESLSGKRLFLIAEVPEPALFQSTSTSIDSDERGGLLQLIGARAPAGVKTYEGTIVVRACLDAGCHRELSVTGGRVPYKLDVKKGLTLSTHSVELKADFGVMPESVEVSVGLPEDVTAWRVEPSQTANFNVFDVQVVEDASGKRLRISAQTLHLPGDDTQELAIVTAVTASGVTLIRGLDIHQITGPVRDRAWAFSRPTVTFNESLSGEEVGYGYIGISALLPNRDSDRFHYLGTTYEWPAEADSSPVRDIWLSTTLYDEGSEVQNDNYYVNLSASSCYLHDCLPPGTYRAVMHYKYSPVDGPEELIDHEITMNVGP